MKMISLDIENVKRIRAVHIEPKGSAVLLNGRNEQGKSSVLDAIAMLLGGKGASTAAPLRRGAKSGSVTADMGEVILTRTWKDDGTDTLKVEAKIDATTRAAIKAPATWLKERVGPSIDIMGFFALCSTAEGQRKQAEIMRNLAGVDTTTLDGIRLSAYDTRAGVNKEIKNAEGALVELAHFPDAPESEVSVADLTKELDAARKANAAKAEAKRKAESRASDVAVCEAEVVRLRRELAAAEVAVTQAVDASTDADCTFADLPTVDEAPILAKFTTISDTNRQVAANATRFAALSRLDRLRKESEALSQKIAKVDEDKAAMLATAKFPVPGLGFGTDGLVTFNSLPLSEASQAQKISIGVAMYLADNPTIRVIPIRDGSNLDQEHLRIIMEMAEERDAQVWIERADRDDVNAIVIEDGEVRGASAAADKKAADLAAATAAYSGKPVTPITLKDDEAPVSETGGVNPHARPGGGEYGRD